MSEAFSSSEYRPDIDPRINGFLTEVYPSKDFNFRIWQILQFYAQFAEGTAFSRSELTEGLNEPDSTLVGRALYLLKSRTQEFEPRYGFLLESVGGGRNVSYRIRFTRPLEECFQSYAGKEVEAGDVENVQQLVRDMLIHSRGLDPRSEEKVSLQMEKPDNWKSLLSNSGWTLLEDRNYKLAAEILAEHEGQSLRVADLRQACGREDMTFVAQLEEKTHHFAPELGFVITSLPGKYGQASLMWLDPEIREYIFYKLVSDENVEHREWTYFDPILPLNQCRFVERFKNRSKQPKPGVSKRASDLRQRQLMRFIVNENVQGNYPAAKEVAEAVGISVPTVRNRVTLGIRHRYDVGAFARFRSKCGLEALLMDMDKVRKDG